MTDWLKLSRTERFTFHDRRGVLRDDDGRARRDPQTHANPATSRRVYDRRRMVKIKSSAY
ncbi:hypothetical protein [Achromobacter piechaudii]|uniref:hypothetical protein n=1 Tax=Achromobacter piechaudii TaxID=72556 RepID=UPI003DA8F671